MRDHRPNGLILSAGEIGKTVVDAESRGIGVVSDVEDSGEMTCIDPQTSIPEKVKGPLDRSDRGDDYPVEIGQVRCIDDDRVEMKEPEELEGSERTR